MSKKRVILIALFSLVLLLLLFLINSVGIYKVDIYPDGDTNVFVRKIKNSHTIFNFTKPSAGNCIKQGDLIVHKNPLKYDQKYSKEKNYCSRVIGLPGDIISIRNTQVYVNDVLYEIESPTWFQYRVNIQEIITFEDLLSDFNVEIVEELSNGKACNIVATEEIAEVIAKLPEVLNVRKITEDADKHNINMFSSKGNTALWNKDNMGPVVVPHRDLTVMLNPRNIGVYKYIIDFHEENELFFDINKITLNGQVVDSYTITENYYFVLNDNRFNRDDSRTWGFIPENQIVGKVIGK